MPFSIHIIIFKYVVINCYLHYNIGMLGKHIILILAVSCFSPAFGNEIERGEKVFKKCRSCHEVGTFAKVKVGPPLNDLVGRVAGRHQGAKYSKAMIAAGGSGLVWTEAVLDQYLTRPRDIVPKTTMTFRGLKKLEDRAAVIAYLKTFLKDEIKVSANNDPAVSSEILAIAGDPEYGEYLSGTCVTCHQVDGSEQGLPSITGWPQATFVTVLHAYKNKHRANPVMQQFAGALSNDEIAALAAYFQSVP